MRGAIPAVPSAAREIFGERLDVAVRYAQLLAGPGIERGLIGPGEVNRLWARHILNCGVVAELIPRPCSLVDIGSGAGLPGIVLAIALQDVSVTLLEPLLRRSAFLSECVTDLGLGNAIVRRARAEDVAGDLSADVVTARAVAPLRRLAGWAMGVVRPGGTILALKGDRADEELRQAHGVLKRLGARRAEILTVGRGKVEPETVVVRIIAGNGRRERSGDA
jgi:16S rRNA (guanine527-N7)-methyltransferase